MNSCKKVLRETGKKANVCNMKTSTYMPIFDLSMNSIKLPNFKFQHMFLCKSVSDIQEKYNKMLRGYFFVCSLPHSSTESCMSVPIPNVGKWTGNY